MLDFMSLLAASQPEVAPGQVVFTVSGTWTVPTGVYAVSMVCVQGGMGDTNRAQTESSVTVAGVVVCRAKRGASVGDAYFDGGLQGLSFREAEGGTNEYGNGGGGGAAGYAGGGGAGGDAYFGGGGPSNWNGKAGSGGGGGGGTCGIPPSSKYGGGGGGVGLLGLGASGPGGVYTGAFGGSGGSGGGGGFELGGGSYGGSRPSREDNLYYRGYGGSLAYANNVAVAPGQVITLVCTASGLINDGAGAIRILWGGGRSYPSNAGNF